MTIEFAVRADAVRLCLPYISKEGTRFYLNGVCFEPGPNGKGVLAVATDGHKLSVAYDEQGMFVDGGDKRPIIKVGGLVSALTGKKDDNPFTMIRDTPRFDRWLVVRDQVAIVVLAESAEAALKLDPLTERTKGVSCGVLIDGTFPDWRRVVPRKAENAGWPAFNAKYLKAIADGYAKVSGSKSPQMRLTSTGNTSPVLINFDVMPDAPRFFAMLTPMRWGAGATELPEWLGLPAEKAAA